MVPRQRIKMSNLISSSRSKLAVQMVLWFSIISLLPLGVVTYFNYKYAAHELNLLVSQNLAAISQRQSREIKAYLKNQERFVTILSLTSDVVRSLIVLNRIDDATTNDNRDSKQLEELRRSFTPILKGIVDQFDFQQMYLVNIDGNINLSIGDTSSNYSNLIEGPLMNTELAKVFKRTMMFMTPQISDFAIDEDSGQIIFYLASPVLSEEKLVGVIILQLDANNIYAITQNYVGLGATGETVICAMIHGEIMILNPTRKSAENPETKFAARRASDEAMKRALSGERGSGEVIDYRGIKVLAAWEYFPKMRWGFIVKIDKSETLRPAMQLRQLSIIIALATLVVVLAAAILVAKSITQPVIALTKVAERIARGDLTPKIGKAPSNEVGLLSAAIETMARNLKSLVNQVKTSGSQVAATIEDVSNTVAQQETAAQDTGSASLEITSSARKISVTAKELTGTMQEVNEVAQDTALLAESGIDGLRIMENSMGELSSANRTVSSELNVIQEKANAIKGIITTMTKVADQTNLLSLNATIEARKAGEYGRGFKVVAKEIRRLADQAARSTLEIEQMIGGMLNAVHNGVHAMDNLSDKIKYGVKEITTVSTHLGNVIQQVQGLPPRFEMVLQGMESQSIRADHIKESIAHLNQSAQKTVASLEITRKKLSLLGKTANALQREISSFQT